MHAVSIFIYQQKMTINNAVRRLDRVSPGMRKTAYYQNLQ